MSKPKAWLAVGTLGRFLTEDGKLALEYDREGYTVTPLFAAEPRVGRRRYSFTFEEVDAMYRLDAATGHLFYRNRRPGVSLMDRAGAVQNDGYRSVPFYIDGKRVRIPEHRIVYMLAHGTCPDLIDHINGDPADNRIENLRACNSTENRFNSKASRSNSTGFKGVYREKSNGRFRAEIMVKQVKHCLGTFATAEEAHDAYVKAAKELHGEFARPA